MAKQIASRSSSSSGSSNSSTSFSDSNSFSGLDYGAKALVDQQFNEGIAAATGLRSSQSADYDKALQQQQQLGVYGRQNINRDMDAAANSVGSRLAGTGLYNSTMQQTMRNGVERERQTALLGHEESLRRDYLDILLSQLGQNSDVDLAALDLYGQRASTLPTYSQSNSNNSSTSNSASSSFSNARSYFR